MSNYSKDYHDYVFNDGKLIAEFDDMYEHSGDIPWHQDKQIDWMDVRLTNEMLKGVGSFDEIHDLACGLGFNLSVLGENLEVNSHQCFGYDISETACRKAKKIFPDFFFQQLDLTKLEYNMFEKQESDKKRRLFVVRCTLWYVFPELSKVIENIKNIMLDDDMLLIVQNFPPFDTAFIGKEVIPDHNSLIRHFNHSFVIVRHLWFEETLKSVNDNWFVGLFSPK
jgi:SAM-dependent methyltransferase